MEPLSFLYWSLGIGWAVLVLFLVLALIYVIRILRDVADTTDVVRNTAVTINDNIGKITDRIVDTAEQITEYIIKPFTMAQYLAEKIKPFVDIVQQKGEEIQDMMDKKKGNDEGAEKQSKRRVFRRKKK